MNAWMAGAVLALAPGLAQDQPGPPHPYRDAAREGLSWLRSRMIETPLGTAWAADPRTPASLSADLYQGVAGVAFALLDASQLTGDPRDGTAARAGADWLLAWLGSEASAAAPCGLYTGLAGVGLVLEKAWQVTGEERYLEGARSCLDRVRARARSPVDAGDGGGASRGGVEWCGGNDIIGGSAGIGLYLLDAARALDRDDAARLARRAGERLLALGREEAGGLDWPIAAGSERRYPNFSHGTAGIAFYLARLAQDSGDESFLEGARRGVAYLRQVASDGPEGCLVFHDRPGGEDLFYLGWCHGPAGTARAFLAVDGDQVRAMEWIRRGAHSIMTSGIPEKPQPGFWNNVSRCCGSAGVADFMIGLYLKTGEAAYLDFARRLADSVIARAQRSADGWCWPQAEHRIHPELIVAQTGLMQGAAGIVLTLLHLDRVLATPAGAPVRADWLRLPDDPF